MWALPGRGRSIMSHYEFNTLGPVGKGEPYSSFCESKGHRMALEVAVSRWIEEYGSIDRMMYFNVYNHDCNKSWTYKISPIIHLDTATSKLRGCGRYKVRLVIPRKKIEASKNNDGLEVPGWKMRFF